MNRSRMFYAGLGVGVGLLGIRMVSARTFGDVVFAGALTLTEFSIVYLWETKGRDLADRIAKWSDTEDRRRCARGMTSAAQAHVTHHASLLAGAESELKDAEDEIELDYLLSDKKALIDIAIGAIRGGYYAGISANAAAVNGGTPRENDDENE